MPGRSPLFYAVVAAVNRQVTRSDSEPPVERLEGIADNLEALALEAARPIVAPALAVLAGLASEEWEPVAAEPAGFWRDLRPSEALALRELVEQAVADIVETCQAAIAQRLGDVAVTFADLYPDAPAGPGPA